MDSVANASIDNAANPYASHAGDSAPAAQFTHLSAPKQRIMVFVDEQKEHQAEGVNTAAIVRHLGNVKEQQVRAYIAELCTEGELYETLEDHYLLA